MKKFFILCLLLQLLSGCVSVMTAEQAAPSANKPSVGDFALAVIDHRPYVVNGEKAPSFEGLSRATIGIPYSQYLTGAMADYLSDRLSAGYQKQGVQVEKIFTSPKSQVNEIEKLNTKTLLVVLHEWKYDYHPFSDNSWYDFDVIVKDQTGQIVVNKNFKGEQDVPSLSSNDLQTLYKTRFEIALNDPEIAKAL